MIKKLSAERIYNTLMPSLPMEELYLEFDVFTKLILKVIEGFECTENIKNDLIRFLKLEILNSSQSNMFIIGKKENIGYTVMLSLIGISREQMKNIIIPYHSYFKNEKGSPNVRRILNNATMLERLADLLLFGYSNRELAKILNGDLITLRRFNISQSSSLDMLFKDRDKLLKVIEDTYKSRMQNKKGYHTEKKILATIVKELGLKYESGELPVLAKYFSRTTTEQERTARNPRIDLIIPSRNNPKILIESTYNLTTASGQTKKMDANDSLYRAIKQYNNSENEELLFINFIDGAGWKSRGFSDVSRLVNSCDYAINYNNLNHFEDILKYYFINIED